MNLQATTIYRKDFSILLRQLAGAIGVQMFLIALIPYLDRMLSDVLRPSGKPGVLSGDTWEWLFKLQLAVHVMTGLIAAVHFSAEERVGGHDWLLRRLPISLSRIRLEKIGAAASIIGIAIILQWLITLGIQSFGITYGENAYNTIRILVALGIISYVVGLSLSYYFNQSIVIVLLGSLILFSLVFFADRLDATPIILTAALGFFIFVIYETSQLSSLFSLPQIRLQYEQIRILVYFGTALFLLTVLTMFSLNYLTKFLFLAAESKLKSAEEHHFEDGLKILFWLIMFGNMTLSTLFGVYTYSPLEKDGLRCTIYHHPISRHRMFWTRYLNGLGLALLSSFCFLVCALVVTEGEFFKVTNAPTFIGTLLLMHIFLYNCGAFTTHANPNQLYAFLETLPVIGLSLVFALLLHSRFIWQHGNFSYIENPFVADGPFILDLVITSLSILTLGLLFAAWRTATDRGLITVNVLRRHIFLGRMLLFVMAITALLHKTDWSDFLFLLTGIDL